MDLPKGKPSYILILPICKYFTYLLCHLQEDLRVSKTHGTVNRAGNSVMRMTRGAPPVGDFLVLILLMMIDVNKRLMICPVRMANWSYFKCIQLYEKIMYLTLELWLSKLLLFDYWFYLPCSQIAANSDFLVYCQLTRERSVKKKPWGKSKSMTFHRFSSSNISPLSGIWREAVVLAPVKKETPLG